MLKSGECWLKFIFYLDNFFFSLGTIQMHERLEHLQRRLQKKPQYFNFPPLTDLQRWAGIYSDDLV